MPILQKEERDGVSILTLNRPEILNAISKALGEALESALLDVARSIRSARKSESGVRSRSAAARLSRL